MTAATATVSASRSSPAVTAALIKKQRPWKGFDDLEIATAEWVD